MSRLCVIFNPAARSEKAKRSVQQMQQLARGVVIKYTSGPGDAEAQAERAVEQGYDIIVAAGGDGTINEVINGLAGSGVTLGILPVGTANVFALELGIPTKLEEAWKVIRQRKARPIDLACANGHYFIQLAGVGLDAQVVEQTSWESKKALGPLSYVLTATQIMGRRPPKLRIYGDHGVSVEGSFVLLGNGRLYGGPFHFFPEADMQDGLLDVCVFKETSYLALARYARGVLFGSDHVNFPDVHYFKSKHVRVESDERVPVEVDGELLGQLPCDFSVQRRKLRVLVP
jgi:YegS/Rv2252/BmrU family lipid kinase